MSTPRMLVTAHTSPHEQIELYPQGKDLLHSPRAVLDTDTPGCSGLREKKPRVTFGVA